MMEVHFSPVHAIPSGLCEDPGGEATSLINRMAHGDGKALEEIFVRWGPVFLGIAQRMLVDPKEAMKAVKETFLRIWRQSADFNAHRSPPFVWAFAILRDHCIQHLHQRRKGPQDSQPSAAIPHLQDPRVDHRVMPADDWHRLKSALDELTAEELGCLETAVFLGYARASLSEADSIPSAQVKTCLRRALEKLRTALSRYEL